MVEFIFGRVKSIPSESISRGPGPVIRIHQDREGRGDWKLFVGEVGVLVKILSVFKRNVEWEGTMEIHPSLPRNLPSHPTLGGNVEQFWSHADLSLSPVPSCLTLSKLFKVSKPQFLHLPNRDKSTVFFSRCLMV